MPALLHAADAAAIAADTPRHEPPARAAALAGPERFLNRELSWLDFNLRVVEEA